MSLLLLFSTPSGQGSTVTGIGSAEAFGVPTVSGGTANWTQTGLPSAEAFGPLAWTPALTQVLPGLSSAEAFGSLSLTPAVFLSPAGLVSAEAFGLLTQTAAAAFSLLGLPSAEAWGGPILAGGPISLTLLGIVSAEALGAAQAGGRNLFTVNGIASAEAWGLPAFAQGLALRTRPIPSGETFGAPRLKLILSKRVTTFPNGQVLTSLALTPQILSTLLQTLTCQMLGLDPAQDALCYAKVRLDWPTSGQPGWKVGDDVCFLQVTEEDDAYNRLRDRRVSPSNATSVVSRDTFTRVWRVSWSFYGPNSFDQARLVKSALLTLDFPAEQLAQANLYLVTDFPATTRAPEKFQGQWWERTDLSVKLNELVEETLTVPTISSVEVILENESGPVADLTVN